MREHKYDILLDVVVKRNIKQIKEGVDYDKCEKELRQEMMRLITQGYMRGRQHMKEEIINKLFEGIN